MTPGGQGARSVPGMPGAPGRPPGWRRRGRSGACSAAGHDRACRRGRGFVSELGVQVQQFPIGEAGVTRNSRRRPNVAAHGNTSGPSLWHGRPVIPDHERKRESPGPAAQPGRVVNAEFPPEDLPGRRVKYLPRHRQVDCGVPDRQSAKVQYRRQAPVAHQQVLRGQVAVVPPRGRPSSPRAAAPLRPTAVRRRQGRTRSHPVPGNARCSAGSPRPWPRAAHPGTTAGPGRRLPRRVPRPAPGHSPPWQGPPPGPPAAGPGASPG